MYSKKFLALSLTLPLLFVGCKQGSNKTSFKTKAAAGKSVADNNNSKPLSGSGPDLNALNSMPRILKDGKTSSNEDACYVELCKDQNSLDIIALKQNYSKGTTEQNAYFDAKVKPTLQEVFEINNAKIKSLEEVKQKFLNKETKDISFTKEELNLIKALLIVTKKTEFIDSADLHKEASDLLIKNEDVQIIAQNINKDLKKTFTLLAKNESTKEAVKVIAKKAIELRLKAFKSLNISGLPESSAFQKALSGEQLTEIESKEILQDYLVATYLVTLTESESGIALLEKVTLDNDKVNTILSGSKSSPLTTEQLSARLADCKADYLAAVSLAPSDQELERLKKLIPEVKRSSLQITSDLNEEQKKKIENLNFVLPKTYGETHRQFVELLKNEIEQEKIIRTFINKGDEKASTLYALILAVTKTPQMFTCSDNFDLDISDSIQTLSGDIMISAYSAKFPEKGAGIVAHAIGHAIENELKGVKESTKACLVEKTQNKDTTTKEDFADLIAAKTLLQLEKDGTIKPKNYACDFLTLTSGDKTELYQLDLNQEHSTALMRALNIHVEGGKSLGAACTKLTEGNQSLRKTCQ